MGQPMLLADPQFQIYLRVLNSSFALVGGTLKAYECEGLISHDHDPCEY
jgi:hypothetical protein